MNVLILRKGIFFHMGADIISGNVSSFSTIVSAALIQPTYMRLAVREPNGVMAHWVALPVFKAYQARPGGGDFNQAAAMAIAACAGEQSIFEQFEIDFVILMQLVEDFGLGYVRDMRKPPFGAGVVEVSFAVDRDRLCLHSMSMDGLTRLYVARKADEEAIEFRLEFFSANEDFELVRSETWPEEVLETEERPILLSWMLSCLTGPLTPAPIFN